MIRLLKTANLDEEKEQTAKDLAIVRETRPVTPDNLRKLSELTRKGRELQKACSLWDEIGQRYHFTEPQDLLEYLLRLVMYMDTK